MYRKYFFNRLKVSCWFSAGSIFCFAFRIICITLRLLCFVCEGERACGGAAAITSATVDYWSQLDSTSTGRIIRCCHIVAYWLFATSKGFVFNNTNYSTKSVWNTFILSRCCTIYRSVRYYRVCSLLTRQRSRGLIIDCTLIKIAHRKLFIIDLDSCLSTNIKYLTDTCLVSPDQETARWGNG